MSKTIRIGGVPEHFNLPIHLAIENNSFVDNHLNIVWSDFEGGTGQMTKALRNDEVDICILLTEGIIADIIHGNPSKLISGFVSTPLIWGIHTGINNPINSYSEIFDKRYAISRIGSGSHLMAIVDANSKGYSIEDNQWNVIGNLNGAIRSLSNLETDIFYWEKFTTKPFVDQKLLKRIGEFLTPWPCFVIAATDKIIREQPEKLNSICKIILKSNSDFMVDKNAVSTIASRYQLQVKDVKDWFNSTEWATNAWISNKMIDSIIYNLEIANIINHTLPASEIIWIRNK